LYGHGYGLYGYGLYGCGYGYGYGYGYGLHTCTRTCILGFHKLCSMCKCLRIHSPASQPVIEEVWSEKDREKETASATGTGSATDLETQDETPTSCVPKVCKLHKPIFSGQATA